MFLLGFVAAALYCAVAVVFMVLSAAELLESGTSSPLRLCGVLAAAALWPVTVSVLSLYVFLNSRIRHRSTDGHAPAFNLRHRFR